MKAKNEVAEKFQAKVADEVIRLEKLGEISNCNFLQLLLPDTFKPSDIPSPLRNQGLFFCGADFDTPSFLCYTPGLSRGHEA